jgi:hypothetical protein
MSVEQAAQTPDAASDNGAGSSEAFDPKLYAVNASNPDPRYTAAREGKVEPAKAVEEQKPEAQEEKPADAAEKPEDKGSSSDTDDAEPKDEAPKPLTEADVERRVQEDIKAREKKVQEEAQAKAQREASEAQSKEIRELFKLATEDNGPAGIKAQQKLLEKYLIDLNQDFQKEELEPKINERLQKFAADKWTEYTGAFEMKPDDADLLAVDPKEGIAGLTEVFVSKTESKRVVKAMLKNPSIQAEIDKRVKAAVEKETEAATLNGVAKAIGNSPKLDAGAGKSANDMTPEEIEVALFKDPHNKELQTLWRQIHS